MNSIMKYSIMKVKKIIIALVLIKLIISNWLKILNDNFCYK